MHDTDLAAPLIDAYHGEVDFFRRFIENRADKWAIQKLVPKDELEEAVSRGITEPWELAEYFDVTPEFMYMAMWYYENGNLALPRQMTGK